MTLENEMPSASHVSGESRMLEIGSGSSTHGRTCRCSVLILPNWTLNFPALACVCHGRFRNVT